MTTDAHVLIASDLRVVRGGRALVHMEHIALAPGEVHVLLGANGAGKSTLLKALNGLEAADGLLEFQGRVVDSPGERLALRRGTAAVFQQPYLLATSVANNVASGLRLRGRLSDASWRRVTEVLDLLGIQHLAERKPDKLSGGEAQRVSIARALAVAPTVLFLDEPLVALDPPTRRALVADLLGIFAQRAMAVVWVTHDRDEALAVGDRVSFLEGGEVVQTGLVPDVFAHPATTSFAEFLGLDTYLEGVIRRSEDGSTRLVLSCGVEIVCGEASEGPAVACLPPEDVVLFRDPPAQGSTSLRNVLPGKVKKVSTAGRLLHVVVESGCLEVVSVVTRAAADDLGITVGVPVVAAFKAAAVHPIPRQERRRAGVAQ